MKFKTFLGSNPFEYATSGTFGHDFKDAKIFKTESGYKVVITDGISFLLERFTTDLKNAKTIAIKILKGK